MAPRWRRSSRCSPSGGIEGRDGQARSRLAAAWGGTPESEAAVEAGLRWLAQHQHPDGGWRFGFRGAPCNGQCRHPGSEGSTTAATGLALMAFLGAGYTHQRGQYADVIDRGLNYLIDRQRITPHGGSLMENTMYDQAIATIALCEALALSRDQRLFEPAQTAVNYILSAQHVAGGWRYNPGQPGDITVTGWQLMALRSAEIAGVRVYHKVWQQARAFLDSVTSSGGAFYGYMQPETQPSPTAIGLLMRMYQGWPLEHAALEQGEAYLAELGPSRTDLYFNYYATLVMHHRRSHRWEPWNEQMRDYLVAMQATQGHEAGSWHFHDQYGSVGGRLYSTAMAIMILEVYYRYLPLYEHGAQVERDEW